ncbi:MAG: glycosyltransferase [Rhodocyclaceae bacterium]|jgi:glycosyltransferase involved in cell wall biosynthesis|nr:glycosyltransferase [Rhodocyclaceae bacterium]
MAPTVSLIIPAYNCAETLERAVLSGLKQSALEAIIIVDDCSSDGSCTIANKLAASDKRILATQTQHNSGPGAARNLGVTLARSDYLSFLDADDEFIDDYFPEAISLIKANPGMHSVKPAEEFIDPTKGYVLPVLDPRYSSAVLSSVHGLIIERTVFDAIGGFPEDSAFRGPFGGEDVAFMQALMEHFQPIGKIDRPVYRVWSKAGTHVDKFLSNTRLTKNSFEFVQLHPDQQLGSILSAALGSYQESISQLLNKRDSQGASEQSITSPFDPDRHNN